MKHYHWLSLAMSRRTVAPVYVVYFVHTECNAGCRHCFVPSLDLAGVPLGASEVARFSRTLGPAMHTLLLTGGEPFLHPDLVEITRALLANADLNVLRVATNGSLPDAVSDWAGRVVGRAGRTRIIVGLSLDGPREVHDRIRRFPGLYDRAVASLQRLREHARTNSQLDVSVTVTVSRHNARCAADFIRYLTDTLGVRNVTTNVVRGQPRDPDSMNVPPRRYAEVSRELSQRLRSGAMSGYSGLFGGDLVNAQNIVTRRRSVQLLLGRARPVRCTAGRVSCVIFPDGSVAPCETANVVIGNLRDYDMDLRRLLRSPAGARARDVLRQRRCQCTHECSAICNVLFNPGRWGDLALAWARIKVGRIRRLIRPTP